MRHHFAPRFSTQLWTGQTIPRHSVASPRCFTTIVPSALSTQLPSVGANSTPVEMDNCIGQNLSHADTAAESDALNRLRSTPYPGRQEYKYSALTTYISSIACPEDAI